nr:integumentary mucin C.1-like [Pocillopora verrucosa]
MEGRFFVLSLLFGAVSVMADGSCQNPKERWECGWLGIDQQTCEARGCCWDPSDPNKPWCYVKPGTYLPDGLCPVAPSERQECGYFGIDKEECLGRSCCWDPIVPNTNWCFTQPCEFIVRKNSQ